MAKSRRIFRISSIIAPLCIPVFIFANGSGLFGARLGAAALAYAAGLGIMTLNGYRTVIGVRCFNNHVQIITYFSQPEFRWREIKLKRHWLLWRTDIYAPGAVWPYMITMSREMKQAVAAMEQCIDRRRYGDSELE